MKIRKTTSLTLPPAAKFLILMLVFISLAAVFAPTPAFSAAPKKFRPPRGYEVRSELEGVSLTADASYTVRLYSKRERGSSFDNPLLLHIRNEATGQDFTRELTGIAGYDAAISAAAFSDRNKSEIFLSMGSGGSGGYGNYYIIAFDGRVAKFIYRSDDDRLPASVQGCFMRGFRCLVRIARLEGSDVPAREVFVDLSSRTDEYREAGVYDTKSGRLIQQVLLSGGTYSAMAPVDTDGDGVCELRGTVAYSGLYQADRICSVTFTQAYSDGVWRAVGAEIAPWEGLDLF